MAKVTVIEKHLVNGRLMSMQAHQFADGQPLPERRRVEALRFPGGDWWHFPIPTPAIRSGPGCGWQIVKEGDVLVVRWVRADQRHYVMRLGLWLCFKSRQASKEYFAEMLPTGKLRPEIQPQLVGRSNRVTLDID
jgi:hypothetical protein